MQLQLLDFKNLSAEMKMGDPEVIVADRGGVSLDGRHNDPNNPHTALQPLPEGHDYSAKSAPTPCSFFTRV